MKKAEPPKPVRPCKRCLGWHRAVVPGRGNPIAGKALQAMPPSTCFSSLPAILCPQRKPQKQKGSAKPLQLPPHTPNSLPRPPEPPWLLRELPSPVSASRAFSLPLPKRSPSPTSRQHPPHPTGSPPGATSTGRPGHSGCATTGRHRAEPCQAGPSPPAPFPAPIRQHRVPPGPRSSPRAHLGGAARPPTSRPLRRCRPRSAPARLRPPWGGSRGLPAPSGAGDEAWAAERWPVMALGAPRVCPRNAEMPRSRP